MAKRRGKGARGGSGGGGGGGTGHRGRPRPDKDARSSSAYFMQPGKRGSVVVLRKPCGNRISPKVCGTMPSRIHAKMLITQLERAESVVNDLFLEATDDGIEALEAILSACCEEVMKRGPATGRRQSASFDEAEADAETSDDASDAGVGSSARNRSEDPAA